MTDKSLFEIALAANLPVIAVSTTDTIYAMAIIEFLSEEPVDFVANATITGLRKVESYVVVLQIERDLDVTDLYALGAELGKSFILINPSEIASEEGMFDAGTLPTPRDMIKEVIKEVVGVSTVTPKFLAVLGGLTLKEVKEVCLLTIARFGSLSPEGVMRMRSIYATRLRGLEQVNLEMPCYLPDSKVVSWVQLNYQPFTSASDPQLIPRGLLLNGIPGVGKTSAAKSIADSMGVPLYRMDVSAMMEKWQGEAERFLRNALDQVDREAPCVLLIDEIEKVFGGRGDEDTGTSSRMLSKLLWWLQEHRTRVITVMTTNAFESLPPEVYRPGRIDAVVEISPLDRKGAVVLARAVYDSLEVDTREQVPQSKVIPRIRSWLDGLGEKSYPHSLVTTQVIEIVKRNMQKI